MNEEEFLALENLLREQFESIGASDLADPTAYLMRERAEEPTRMRDPRDRLLQMLEALDRRLAIEDGDTFGEAMAILRESTDGAMPEQVLVEPVSEVEPMVDLSVTPNLRELRTRLRRLIGNLAETPYSE
jgi:hypothetical protein